MVQEVEVKTSHSAHYINSHFAELAEQFEIYTETIQPLIVHIEEMKSQFPPEILNEVRAMYTHLSRAFLTENEQDVISNIEKIKRHTKRALLDCFKNCCIIIIDKEREFFRRYKGIDLSYIDEGEFLKEEKKAFDECATALMDAKKAEGLNTDDDILFKLYENAYQKGLILEDIIDQAEKKANFLKRKALKRDIIATTFGIIGVVGTIFTIVGFFM